MMKSLLVLVFFANNLFAQDYSPISFLYPGATSVQCSMEEVDEGPFLVTDAYKMGWKTYENFRSKDNHSKKENIIPRRSIVKVSKESSEYAKHPDAYIPVEVLGVADTDLHDKNLKEGRLNSASADVSWQKLKKVNVGKKGFMHTNSLKQADEYTYIVTEDSPILADNGLTEMGVVAITPTKSYDGKYQVEKCCEKSTQISMVALPKCTQKYQFRLVYTDNTMGKEVLIDIDACNIADNLIPFKNENVTALMNFMTSAKNGGTGFDSGKLEIIDERGMVKVPLDYAKSDGQGVPGPFGSYHYNLDDDGASDAYAKPLTNCAFMKVLEEHQKSCDGPGCQIQFGDMFHLRDWGPHNFHGAGKCIDIRPLKKADSKLGVDRYNPNYDRVKTQAFINLLTKAGGTSLIFDDPKVTGAIRSGDHSHNDHIHVCFDPESLKVQKTCYKGIE